MIEASRYTKDLIIVLTSWCLCLCLVLGAAMLVVLVLTEAALYAAGWALPIILGAML